MNFLLTMDQMFIWGQRNTGEADAPGNIVDHDVNNRVISVKLSQLRRTPERVLISGGRDKLVAMRAALRILAPTTLITDEQTATALID